MRKVIDKEDRMVYIPVSRKTARMLYKTEEFKENIFFEKLDTGGYNNLVLEEEDLELTDEFALGIGWLDMLVHQNLVKECPVCKGVIESSKDLFNNEYKCQRCDHTFRIKMDPVK